MVYDRASNLTEDEKESQELPVIKKGDKLNITAVESKKLEAKLPARFNRGQGEGQIYFCVKFKIIKIKNDIEGSA